VHPSAGRLRHRARSRRRGDPHSRLPVIAGHHALTAKPAPAHQGEIDWDGVAGDDIGFAYIKATEGRDVSDRRFASNWTAARAAGLEVGAYHYFTLCSDAAAQADHFLETAPSGPDDLPPVVDLEDLDGACDPSAVEVRSEVQRFVAEVERRTSGNAAWSVGPTSTDGSSGRPTGGHG
jgi:lysozyme